MLLLCLQLVQALKYEDVHEGEYVDLDSHLKDMLIDKSLDCVDFAHTLFWHLELER